VTDSSSLTDTAICTRSSTKGAIVSDIRVVGFAGSLRRASYNRGLIRAAAELAPPGIVVEVFDLGDMPLYNQDVEDAGEPAAVVAFKQAIERSDAMLVATPEYNHGIPGVLKNALDWASRPRVTSPLRDKAAGRESRSRIDCARPGPAARRVRVHRSLRDAVAGAAGRQRGPAFRRRWEPDGRSLAHVVGRACRGLAGVDAPDRPPTRGCVTSSRRALTRGER
jgi:NAD(P)H-dependent FMN reductase